MHLSDCFMELVAYVTYFLKAVEVKQPSYELTRGDIKRLLDQSEAAVRKGHFPENEFDQARFAVCAWIDEALLGSSWQQRNLWMKEPLQRSFYNTNDAGEEFFDRLDTLGLHQREVREVYYLCLALGFTGRYCHPGNEYQLEQIKTSNLKLLLGSSVGLPSLERTDLFPEAYAAGHVEMVSHKTRAGSSLITVICLVGPILLFLVMYLIYRFTLSGIGENFLRTVS